MRGTGKTTRLLKATPARGIFIVQSQSMVGYMRDWIRTNGRGDDDIRVVSVDNLETIRGFQRPIAIDHCVETQLLTEEQQEELMIAIGLAPFIVQCDLEGDVVIEWNE